MINMSFATFSRLAATFTFAGTALMAGCATTPQQGCKNVDRIKNEVGMSSDGSINPLKKAGAELVAIIPVVGPISMGVLGHNIRECNRAAPAPAPASSK